MKTDREPNDIDGLLNAVLADDDWRTLNCSLKREALTAIGAARRTRRLRLRIGQVACVSLLLVAAGWRLHPSARGTVSVAETPGQSPPVPAKEHFISEDEMLAMFPAGSCVLAEVNGQKTLVFLDAKKAEEGFAWSSP